MRNVFLVIVVVLCGCSTTKETIYVEKIPQNLLKNENRFDLDNKTFPAKKEALFKFSLSRNDTLLETKTNLIKLNILGTTKPFSNFDADYSQTVIQYSYYDKENKLLISEKTGLIERIKCQLIFLDHRNGFRNRL